MFNGERCSNLAIYYSFDYFINVLLTALVIKVYFFTLHFILVLVFNFLKAYTIFSVLFLLVISF
jgi:hypothetical protein